jgi:hypothetical protein
MARTRCGPDHCDLHRELPSAQHSGRDKWYRDIALWPARHRPCLFGCRGGARRSRARPLDTSASSKRPESAAAMIPVHAQQRHAGGRDDEVMYGQLHGGSTVFCAGDSRAAGFSRVLTPAQERAGHRGEDHRVWQAALVLYGPGHFAASDLRGRRGETGAARRLPGLELLSGARARLIGRQASLVARVITSSTSTNRSRLARRPALPGNHRMSLVQAQQIGNASEVLHLHILTRKIRQFSPARTPVGCTAYLTNFPPSRSDHGRRRPFPHS